MLVHSPIWSTKLHNEEKFDSWTNNKAKANLGLISSTTSLKDFCETDKWVIVDEPGYKHNIK